MVDIPQPENQSAQDDVDTLMVRSRINEAIANLLSIKKYFETHRPTPGRDKAIAAAERSIKSLRDHLDVIQAELMIRHLDNNPKPPT